jgi:peptidoglycan/LPS O-acetylase OafA/YrhL
MVSNEYEAVQMSPTSQMDYDKEEHEDESVEQEEEQQQHASRFIPGLHGLRGVAALSIGFSHAYPHIRWLTSLSGIGMMGFMMMSGHLITGILLRTTIGKHNKAKNWILFGLARFIRIYPALMLAALYTTVVRLQRGDDAGDVKEQTMTSLLQVENFYARKHSQIGGHLTHTWYIGIEQQFYCFWPFVVAFLAKRSIRFRAIVLVSMVVFIHAVTYLFQLRMAIRPWQFLIAGGAMQLLPMPDKIVRWRWLTWLGLLSAIPQIMYNPSKTTVGWTAPLTIFALIHGCTHHGNIILEHPILVFLGRISYAYYVFHHPLMAAANVLHKSEVLGLWIAIGTVVIASLSTLYVEEPLRDRLKAYMIKKHQASSNEENKV